MVQIRNRLGALAFAAALSLAGSAHAATFDLSYTFRDTGDHILDIISGTVDGDLNGSFVENLHNFNLSYDGNAFTGTITALGWDPVAEAPSADPARLSADASLNQIIFSNADYTFTFAMINDPSQGGLLVSASDANLLTHNAASEIGVNAGQWSLVPSAVPEPGAFAMALAGLGLLGVVARRRRAQ